MHILFAAKRTTWMPLVSFSEVSWKHAGLAGKWNCQLALASSCFPLPVSYSVLTSLLGHSPQNTHSVWLGSTRHAWLSGHRLSTVYFFFVALSWHKFGRSSRWESGRREAVGRCGACDACLTSKIGGYFRTEGTSGLYGLIKRGARTLWMLTLMRIDPPQPSNPCCVYTRKHFCVPNPRKCLP